MAWRFTAQILPDIDDNAVCSPNATPKSGSPRCRFCVDRSAQGVQDLKRSRPRLGHRYCREDDVLEPSARSITLERLQRAFVDDAHSCTPYAIAKARQNATCDATFMRIE
jgi:hypothetical protein